MSKKKVEEIETFTNEMKLEFLNCVTVEKLKVFLNSFDIQSSDKFGNNILHYYLNNMKSFVLTWNIVIPEILDRGMNVNQKQSKGTFGRSPLHLAVFLQEKEITEYLLNNGADINSIDANGNSIIFTAVIKYDGDGYFIELLINKGADVFLENNYEISAFSLAESIANYDVAKYFKHKQDRK